MYYKKSAIFLGAIYFRLYFRIMKDLIFQKKANMWVCMFVSAGRTWLQINRREKGMFNVKIGIPDDELNVQNFSTVYSESFVGVHKDYFAPIDIKEGLVVRLESESEIDSAKILDRGELFFDAPLWFSASLVCWYDPKLQGCTNERMAANPILKDLSGNGNDMQCNNFAWNEESGISADGLVFDGVDNFCLCIGRFALDDFTLICNREIEEFIKLLETGAPWPSLGSKSPVSGSGYLFIAEQVGPGKELLVGVNSRPNSVPAGLLKSGTSVFSNANYYNIDDPSHSLALMSGVFTDSDSNILCIGKTRGASTSYAPLTLKQYLLFNRSLTDAEVEWIKDNIIRPLPMHEALMRSCVAWYSPKKQGATNLSMAQNPTLYDFSGKGIDLKCYNFAWNTQSGIDANGAIHFDGVTSYCKQIDGRKKMSNGFTVIYKRAIRETDSQYNWLFSDNSVSRIKNVLTCSPKALEDISDYVSFGYNNTNLPKVPTGTGVEYMQPTKFVDIDGNTFNIRKGSYNDDNVSPFIFGRNRDYGSGIDNFYTEYSLFDFILFDRVLSDVEIQYVKDNMISK